MKIKLGMILAAITAALSIGASAALVGEGTEASPYKISDEASFKEFVTLAESNSYEGVYFEQTADITISSGYSFNGIGNENKPFKGIYNGMDYTISGLAMRVDSGICGLFAVAENASISNIKVENSRVNARVYTGGIVAKAMGTTVIDNCSFKGTITFSSAAMSLAARFGSIAGYVDTNASVVNCVNDCEITAASVPFISYIGGIAGHNMGTISECVNNVNISVESKTYLVSVGGIAGQNAGKISGCINNGTVTGTTSNDLAAFYAGGVVGFNDGGSVERVQNNAKVNVISNGKYPGYAGGIAGYNNNGTVTDSKNKGDITSEGSYTGGIAGINLAENSSASIENTLNTGAVTGTGGALGGIAGANMAVANHENAANITSSLNSVSGNAVAGKTVELDDATSNIVNVYALNSTDTNAISKNESELTSATSLSGLTSDAWVYPGNGYTPNLAVVKNLAEVEVVALDKKNDSVAFTVYNPGTEIANASAIVSYFDENGRITGASVETIGAANGYTTHVAFSENAAENDVRVMVFSSLSGIIPVASVANY